MVRRIRAQGRTFRAGSRRDLVHGLGIGAAGTAAALLARRHLGALAELRPAPDAEPVDADVVVPARDEAASIAACVGALRAQTRRMVTVVDDVSGDGTGEVAARAGADVLGSGGPPPGWTGKAHACAAGAAAGSAPWIVFVDADVWLEPGALAALVAHADATGLDAVSPLLRQRCSGLADSLVVPLAFWQYAVGMPGAGQGGGRAILNGQCVAVRRPAYARSGGHAAPAVRGSVIEDSALARTLVGSGAAVGLVRGTALGEVAMYSGASELRAGFGKNATAFLVADPAPGLLVAAAGTAMTACLPLLLRAVRRPGPAGLFSVVAAWTPWAVALVPRYREAGVPAAMALAHPVAALAMQTIALEGMVRAALRRPPLWKGRRAAAV